LYFQFELKGQNEINVKKYLKIEVRNGTPKMQIMWKYPSFLAFKNFNTSKYGFPELDLSVNSSQINEKSRTIGTSPIEKIHLHLQKKNQVCPTVNASQPNPQISPKKTSMFVRDSNIISKTHNPERSKSRKTQNPDKLKIPTNSKSRQTQNPDKLKIPKK
jgi:hypothetical protein